MNQKYNTKSCHYCQSNEVSTDKFSLHIVKRSKGAYLHNREGIRFIDFHLEDASLLLGHAHSYLTRQIKNSISKGYVYPAPEKLFKQLKKELANTYPQFDHIDFFHSFNNLIHHFTYHPDSKNQHKILFFGSQYQTKWYPYLNYTQNVIILGSNNIQHLSDALHQDNKIGVLCLASINLYPHLKEHDSYFWQHVHQLCQKHQVQLIVDKSIDGFHYSSSVAEKYAHGIILGKQIASGLSLYALLQKDKPREPLSSYFSPAYSAALYTQHYIQRHQSIIELHKLAIWCKQTAQKRNLLIQVHGSIIFMAPHLDNLDAEKLHLHFLKHGIFTNPWHSQLCFLCTQHTQNHLTHFLDAYDCFLNTTT